MEKILNGCLSAEISKEYPSGFKVDSFFDYVANKVNIEGVLSVAGILFPDFIVKDKYVFLKNNYETYKQYGDTSPYGNDKRSIERFVNLLCLSGFFMKRMRMSRHTYYFQMQIIIYCI